MSSDDDRKRREEIEVGNNRMQTERVGKGIETRPGTRRIVVDFETMQFETIRALATENGTSIAATVRNLVAKGLTVR